MRSGIVVGVALALVGGAAWWYVSYPASKGEEMVQERETAPTSERVPEDTRVIDAQGAAIGEENVADFKCDQGRTITAVFERDIVGLTLSDGRQLVLREALSTSGMRYLSNDTKIEFRGKERTGALIEDGKTTYANCEVK